MKGQTSKFIREQRIARKLRSDTTEAERALWRAIRRRQLAGYKFRRQHPFGDYVLDFVCLEAGVVVEIDGGQHADRREKDAVRSADLERAGFRVLRFWNDEVLRNPTEVVEQIWRALSDPTR